MAERVLTLRELNRATLARQGLLERWDDADAVEALRRVAGLQAQEPRPPFIGLWTRMETFTAEELLGALRSGAAVRAPLMRGTLHIVAAEDWPLFFGPPDRTRNVLGERSRDLDPEPVLAAAEALLRERGPMSMNDLRPLLAERFPGEDERVMGYAARLLLPLVMVPTDDRWGYGRDPVFGLSDLALPRKRDDAELVRRYLAAFGPATVEDMQTWSGRQGLRAVVEAMADELVSFAGGLVDLSGAPRPPEDAPGRDVVFLPDFDNLLLAHKDRRRVIADEHRPLVATKNLRIKATFLVDGVVAGTWSIKATKTKATVTLEPFGKIPRAAVREEATALARFLEPDAKAVSVT
ncbi:winged helix DNA-binding domain-containing protein [Svornostia abyssi]|uniref:Winged helix DNA-binding domain-containing protein n=1 Tax=Svornostia abyssi TaxID=2898438 RepID=A0ABY5PG85_9ACTN|nr:winged helix DNA-binding domain-containing protein [Parviterribacteraceae bacterium J379]